MAESGVVFHPEAIAEARAAFLWYRDRNEQVSWRFLAELESAIRRISNTPDQCPRYYVGTQYARLNRFPYLVVLVAVAHGHRSPGYWKHR